MYKRNKSIQSTFPIIFAYNETSSRRNINFISKMAHLIITARRAYKFTRLTFNNFYPSSLGKHIRIRSTHIRVNLFPVVFLSRSNSCTIKSKKSTYVRRSSLPVGTNDSSAGAGTGADFDNFGDTGPPPDWFLSPGPL